jgi:methionine-S-sulfoxide reductase
MSETMRRIGWLSIVLLGLLLINAGCAGGRMNVTEEEGVQERDVEVTRPSIDGEGPAVTETAAFGLGCFWGVESLFGSVPGVVRTRVGYTGGTKQHPTYHRLGDHTETVEVVYDPTQVSYEMLLDLFWANHTPTSRSYSPQYKNVVFTYTEEQRELALASQQRQAEKHGQEIGTEVLPATEFYPAEDYHQKFRLQNTDVLMREFEAIYPDFGRFVDSTAAARINGYLGGHGSREWLESHIGELGLSEEGQQWLLEHARRR